MTKKTLEIHSKNILPIIKKWLYSDKDIFVRELVSNACDAIRKLKVLSDQGDAQIGDDEFRIDIRADKEKGTLTFIDNGIGMTAEEVEKYIAQIAFSGAEEFMKKYESNQEKDQIIGHFGLGFYSSYMVADKVDIDTLSYKTDAEPALWSCDGSSEYDLTKGSRETRGTTITLHVGKDNKEFLDEQYLKQILEQYCTFMPFPIYLGETHVNHKEPLWVKAPSECSDQEYLEFYRYLYPMEEDPLFWVHLNVDYPFHLKGILYFPRIRADFDLNKSHVKLFCNRVFVSDNCKDLIPNYLMVLRGTIDSPDIPLNVSRSYLQMDRTVRQLGSHISKKVSDSLSSLYRSNKERFLEIWDDVSTIVKLGVMEDEKFYDRVKSFLVWKNMDDEWTTVEEYLERNKEKIENKVIYSREENVQSHYIDIYKDRGIEVLSAPSRIDPYVMSHLEAKLSPVKFQRVDAAVDDSLIDKEREKGILDAEGKTEATRLADFVRAKLDDEMIDVEAKSLASDTIPAMVVMDENQRRMRDYMRSMNQKGGDLLMGKRTFVVNTNNPLIAGIQKIDKDDPDLAKALLQQVYDLSLLSQREMDTQALHAFVKRSNSMLEKLSEKLGKE